MFFLNIISYRIGGEKIYILIYFGKGYFSVGILLTTQSDNTIKQNKIIAKPPCLIYKRWPNQKKKKKS